MSVWTLFLEYRADLQYTASWLICLAALYWGSWPERLVALVWIVLFHIVDGIYHQLFDTEYIFTGVDVWHAGLDALAAAAWMFIAVQSNRNYPMWIAALQILAACAHLARGIAEPITQIAYATMAFAPGYLQLIIFAAGLIRHVLRKQQHGEYRDWRPPLVNPFRARTIHDIPKGQT